MNEPQMLIIASAPSKSSGISVMLTAIQSVSMPLTEAKWCTLVPKAVEDINTGPSMQCQTRFGHSKINFVCNAGQAV